MVVVGIISCVVYLWWKKKFWSCGAETRLGVIGEKNSEQFVLTDVKG